jgi:hypothetical protein
MQRRMDYSPDVTGKPPVAHYTYDHKTFDGFVFPTRRMVYLHDANGVANPDFAPITIDVASVTVDRRASRAPQTNSLRSETSRPNGALVFEEAVSEAAREKR